MEQRLAPYPVGPSGLQAQPDAPYDRSHRHPMHLFPIFPGGDLNVEGSAADRKLIERSIQSWIFRGTGKWTGWSYPYASLIASQVRRANQALNELEIYKQAFNWSNDFHVNGDYHGYGYSTHEYQPFTVEGKCAFAAAVKGMLFQSWGDKIRVFPSVPDAWKDVSFEDLRAQGGFLVSVQMVNGEIISASISSPKGWRLQSSVSSGLRCAGPDIQEKDFPFTAWRSNPNSCEMKYLAAFAGTGCNRDITDATLWFWYNAPNQPVVKVIDQMVWSQPGR